MCYSPSARGFFRTDIHGSGMPTDCVSLTDAEYDDLMSKQARGFVIEPVNGRPMAVRPVVEEIDPRGVPMSALEFRRRFTLEERGRITKLAAEMNNNGDPTLQVFLDDLAAAGSVYLNDPEIVQGVEYCAAKGLITPRRADAILGR